MPTSGLSSAIAAMWKSIELSPDQVTLGTIVAPEVPYSRSDTFLTPHFKAMRKKYPEYSTNLLSMVGEPAERVRIAPQVKVFAPSRLAANVGLCHHRSPRYSSGVRAP